MGKKNNIQIFEFNTVFGDLGLHRNEHIHNLMNYECDFFHTHIPPHCHT